ncbi:MAG: hypothetical protein RL220_1760, partial [Bacteroidota bacterium]
MTLEQDKKKLISNEALAAATRMTKDNPVLHLLSRVTRIDNLNELYDDLCRVEKERFIDQLFINLDLDFEFDQSQLDHIPKSGPFIVVSNHPFGALDGLALINAITRVRPDFKMMANFLLQNVEPIRHHFIAVNPFEGNRSSFSNISGLKAAMQHLSDGLPLGIFPAGEVSTFNGDLRTISDRKWQSSALKIIRNAKVPVIPVFFDG